MCSPPTEKRVPALREQSKTGLGLREVWSCHVPSGFTLALGDMGQRSHSGAARTVVTSSRRERTEIFLQRNAPQPWVTWVSKVRNSTILAISTHRAHKLAHSLAFPWCYKTQWVWAVGGSQAGEHSHAQKGCMGIRAQEIQHSPLRSRHTEQHVHTERRIER